jgi:hypothetical protein
VQEKCILKLYLPHQNPLNKWKRGQFIFYVAGTIPIIQGVPVILRSGLKGIKKEVFTTPVRDFL